MASGFRDRGTAFASKISSGLRFRGSIGALVTPGVKVKRVVKPDSETIDDQQIAEFLQNVNHGAPAQARRLSSAQLRSRGEMLKNGQTPRSIARHHIVERNTYRNLVLKLIISVGFSVGLIVCGSTSQSAAEIDGIDSGVGTLMWRCGVMMLSSSLIGIRGALRVRKDIAEDDDGLGTYGQLLLQVYFHISFGFNLVLIPVSLAVLTDPDSFLNDGAYGDTEFYAKQGSIWAILIAIITCFAMRATVKIVTPYEMAQSFLEAFSTILVGLGVLGLVASFSFLEFGQFMTEDSLDSTFITVLYFFISLCCLLVILSVFGFGAAIIENKFLLKIHAFSLMFLFICVLAVFIIFVKTDFNAFISDRCRNVLQIMADYWWKDKVGCHKYGGAAMGAQIEQYDSNTGDFYFSSNGVGRFARCPTPELKAFAWEYGVVEHLEGCLNEACCQNLIHYIQQLTSLMIFGMISLLLCFVIAIKADHWLIFHNPRKDDKVKLVSRQRARVLLGVVAVLIVGAAISIALVFDQQSTQVDPKEVASSLNKDIVLATPPEILPELKEVHSCNNNLQDGNETDIDCGGNQQFGGCNARCAVGKQCEGNSDCASGHCNMTTGLCRRETLLEQCTNGIRDGSETGVDCGGGECKELLLDLLQGNETFDSDQSFLCSIGDACFVDDDCLSSFCDNGVCSSCQDGIQNTGEGDIDCGSPQCVQYYLTYPSDQPANVSSAGNADGQGLCLDGRTCSSPSQCSSGICNEETGTCVSCSNGIQDGDESDVDCGGKVCKRRCTVGQTCTHRFDCSTQRCTTSCSDGFCEVGVCEAIYDQIPSSFYSNNPQLHSDEDSAFTMIAVECTDQVLSVHETDIDCGGSLCPLLGLLCDDGNKCKQNTDCNSNMCHHGNCVSCENGFKDGEETGVDCGGSVCHKRCGLDQTCSSSFDCGTNLFCFSNYSLFQILDTAATFNLSVSADDFPPVFTCQPSTTIRIDNHASTLQIDGQGTSLGSVFSEPYEGLPPARAASVGEDDDNFPIDDDNETRRVLLEWQQTSFGERYHHMFHGQRHMESGDIRHNLVSPLAVMGQPSLAGRRNLHLLKGLLGKISHRKWPYWCKGISTFEVNANYKFHVIDDNGAKIIFHKNNHITITRKLFDGMPEILLIPDTCSINNGDDGILVKRTNTFERWCDWLRCEDAVIASLKIAQTTTIRGRILSNGVGIPGAVIRMWSLRKGSCVTSPTKGHKKKCEDVDCDSYDNLFQGCARQGDCCDWEESGNVFVSQCSGSSVEDTKLVSTTDESGYFSIVIPLFEELADKKQQFRLQYSASHDNFVTSQGNIVYITPGTDLELPDTNVAPEPMEICGCTSYDKKRIEDDEIVCRNPVTRECFERISGSSCSAEYSHLKACNNWATDAPTGVPTPSPTTPQLVANTIVDYIKLNQDWTLSFNITLHGLVEEWSNVLHVGSENYERIPGVWFYPNSQRLHFRTSTTSWNNDGCDPPQLLEFDRVYQIKVEHFMQQMTVWYDDFENPVCTKSLPAPMKVSDGLRPLYISDPWYPGSKATIEAVSFANITDRPTPQPTRSTPVLEQGNQVGTLILNRDWSVSFKMTLYGVQNGWSNVFHVGDSDAVRRPAVFVYPGSQRLHFRVGTKHVWNGGCDPTELLELGRTYDIYMEVFMDKLIILYDGVEVCSHFLEDVLPFEDPLPLYVSDPWRPGAMCELEDLAFANITGRPTPAPVGPLPQLPNRNHVGDVFLLEDWQVSFNLTLYDVSSHWSNVFHLGNADRERVPAVWIYPNQRRLHFRVSSCEAWNDGCDPSMLLTYGQKYEIRAEHFGTILSIYIDGMLECQSEIVSGFKTLGPRKLWVANPWHVPAFVELDGPKFENITDRATFAPVASPPQLTAGTIDRYVKLGRYYSLDFDLTVHKVLSGFGNILHLGSENQRRSPAIWTRPFSSRLHFRVTSLNHFNSGCDPNEPLHLGQQYNIRLEVFYNIIRIYYDSRLVCSRRLHGPAKTYDDADDIANNGQPLYISDPWHRPAYASISDVQFTNEAECTPIGGNIEETGVQISCCSGSVSCLYDWNGDGNEFHRCAKTTQLCAEGKTDCTDIGDDPYSSGDYIECCDSGFSCFGDWDDDANFHYRCAQTEELCELGFMVAQPSDSPSTSPTETPSREPTRNPTASPSSSPSPSPSVSPSRSPSASPSSNPTSSPSKSPSESPTSSPSESPSKSPTSSPSTSPSENPTSNPSSSPSASPSKSPTTKTPTGVPTSSPSASPTNSPSVSPTGAPSTSPTISPTHSPSMNPTSSPSNSPTISPTDAPSTSPTQSPSKSPTESPTASPTDAPSTSPTTSPSKSPTSSPTDSPSKSPTNSPTDSPSTSPTTSPTASPSTSPTTNPTESPSTSPTSSPSESPTSSPSASPSSSPSKSPTSSPSSNPTTSPSTSPTESPTDSPTSAPSVSPSNSPSSNPTVSPTSSPVTPEPTGGPTNAPSISPTDSPSTSPTVSPSDSPSISPTNAPTADPTISPTDSPTTDPTISPTNSPSVHPTANPSGSPSTHPTSDPTISPTTSPSASPSSSPSKTPTVSPTDAPSTSPSSSPSQSPTGSPTHYPTFAPTLTVEPFVSFTYDTKEFEWIQDVWDNLYDFIRDVNEEGAGDEEFSRLSQFTATWTELFLVLGPAGSCVENTLTTSMVRDARCGPWLGPSSCVVTLTNDEETDGVWVEINITISSLGDIAIVDRLKSSPVYGTFLPRLDLNCGGEITIMYESIVQGTVTAELTVLDFSASNINDKIQVIQEILLEINMADLEENFKRFPSSTYLEVDRCPPSRLCSGNGVCCTELSQYETQCPDLGLCFCNSGYAGFDCGADVTSAMTRTDTRRCIPRDFVGGEASSAVILAICAAENACEENQLLCTYFEEFDYSQPIDGCPNGDWVEVFHQYECRTTLNLGRETINALFDFNRMWRYDISGSPYLYYRFLNLTRPLPTGYSAFDLMVDNWASLNGQHLLNVDFELFASAEDLVNGLHRWNWTNYDDNVGFPRDARPLASGSSSYFREYYWKWAKAYCNIVGRKTTPVKDFGFSLCIPTGIHAGLPAHVAPDRHSISGKVTNVVTGEGVWARVKLFQGVAPAWSDGSLLAEVETTVEYGSLDLSSLTECAPSEFVQNGTANTQTIVSSTYSFDNLSPGSYTLVFLRGDDGDLSPFRERVKIVDIEDEDMEVNIAMVPDLKFGSMLAVFETNADDLDLIVQYEISSAGETATCKLSADLLSDDACSCSGGRLVRIDENANTGAGSNVQVIYFENVRKTIYKFFLGRNRPVPSSSYKKHRDDGRCGPDFPLEDGEPSQCPPIPVVWDDGVESLRPCCHIVAGQCGLSEYHCNHRYSIDYRMFLDDNWKNQVREDGRCNRPDLLSPDGLTATCPEDRPCCSPQAYCGGQSYHCDSPRSVDYRSFYNKSYSSVSDAGTSLAGLKPVEESKSVVTIYTPSGLGKVFNLPDPTEPLNYFDGHEYVDGEATTSSSFVRAFCIDSTKTSPMVHDYPSPNYFAWEGQMLGMSTSCPATSDCSYVRLGNLRSEFDRPDDIRTPNMNGIYLRRYQVGGGFKAYPGYYPSSWDRVCRVPIMDSDTGKNIWAKFLVESEGEKDCLEICNDYEDCTAMYYVEYIDWKTQTLQRRCTFHKSMHLCGGFTSRGVWENKYQMVYEKQSSNSGNMIWYQHLETLFGDAKSQIQLYRDEATLTWYLDDDRIPGNGYYAMASTTADSETPPRFGWKYLMNFKELSHQTQMTPVSVTSYMEDCLVGSHYPTLNGTAEDKGCICQSGTCQEVQCDSFPIRVTLTNICMEGNPIMGKLISNQCDPYRSMQRFRYNKVTQGLELFIDGMSYVIYLNEENEFLITADTKSVTPTKFAFTLDAQICLQEDRIITSYLEEQMDDRSCIFLASAPGDTPLLVNATFQSEWSSFEVV